MPARKKTTRAAKKRPSIVKRKTPASATKARERKSQLSSTDVAAQKPLTIYFVGLCLFTKGAADDIHVFLPQPKHLPYPMSDGMSHGGGQGMTHDRTHRTTLLLPRGSEWAACEITPGETLTFGSGSQGATMPGNSDLCNVSQLPQGKKLAKAEAKADTDVRNSHVILNGGTLTVDTRDIGRWAVTGQTGEAHFPRMVTWVGSDASGWPDDTIVIWNAMPDESPSPTYPSIIPTKGPDAGTAAQRAADHFKAYFHILGGVPGPAITYLGPLVPESVHGPMKFTSIIVSSCPSGGGDLNP